MGVVLPIASILLLFGWAVGPLDAQNQRRFDVVSVKSHDPRSPAQSLRLTPKGIEYRGATLYECIKIAYSLADYQLKAGDSNLIVNDRFDVLATNSEAATPGELMSMLRLLLADRFGLTVHEERRRMATYRLVRSGKGSNLKPSDTTTGMQKAGTAQVTFTATSMFELTDFLSGLASVNKPVVDRSRMEGRYDFVLRMADWPDGPEHRYDEHLIYEWLSIFTDIQRLGLRLEPGHDLITVLIVDHAQAPSAN